MSSVVETRPAGWRPDPSGRYEWRYWDGGWTNRVANSATPAKPATKQAPAPVTRTANPGGSATHTAPPASQSEQAVLRAVAAGRPTVKGRAAKTPAPVPGSQPPAYPPEPPAAPPPPRTGLVAAIVRWYRSFTDQEESYHSPKAGVALPPHPKRAMIAHEPGNYGRAGIVALAACGMGVGAYLPWLSGTIGASPFERTGFELGKAWGFTWLAAALALAAICAVRMRWVRWVNMGLAVVAAVLTARELVNVHDLVTSMNAAAVVQADVGIGLWIMLVSAAAALIASFRIEIPGEIS